MRPALTFIALLWLLPGSQVMAGPAPVPDGFAPIALSPIGVRLTPFVTVPADAAEAPVARINYVVPLRDSSGRLFINNLNGVLFQTNSSGSAPVPYLDLRTALPGFSAGVDPGGPGLAGMAFHPNFNGNAALPGFGVFYTTSWAAKDATPFTFAGNSAGDAAVVIREWTAADPQAGTFHGTSREVMRLGGYVGGHINGTIAFNPNATVPGSRDYGMLYIGNGDGDYNDPAHNAPNMAVPLGKILRIDPAQGANGAAYAVPGDNPFVGNSAVLPEIWASGLRNPQSFSWDIGGTGAMFINDIGQGRIEEVDLGVAGADYGWPDRTGTFATGYLFGTDPENEDIYALPANDAMHGYVYPVAEYSHAEGNAVGSGFVYRGTAIPALDGKYVMADIVNGRLFVFDPDAATPGNPAGLQELQVYDSDGPIRLTTLYGYESWLTSPRVDARLSQTGSGELLLALKSTGQIFALTAFDVPAPDGLPVAVGLALLAATRLRSRSPARLPSG